MIFNDKLILRELSRSYNELSFLNIKANLIMSALDDLNAAITSLTASVSAEITALQTAMAGSDTAGIEAAVSNLQSLNTQLQNSLVPATAPAPVVA